MNPSRRRLLVEQIVAVAVLECGMKVDAMWHVPQLLYTSKCFSILENKLISYADGSTLMAVVPSPGVGATVAESLCGVRDA